jgi:hypothetical protein
MAQQLYTVNQDPNDWVNLYDLIGVHPEYHNNYQRWQFLYNSYLGGQHYKLGKYITRYVYESESEYAQRLVSTPLDNHAKSVVHIMNSFLFRHKAKRDFGSITGNPELEPFLKDADLEGRTWDAFMRDVNIHSTIAGHCLVLLDRPQSNAGTKAEELAQGIRTYANLYTAPNILDWGFERLPSGHYELNYLKLLESEKRAYGAVSDYFVRTFTREEVILEKYSPSKSNKGDEVISVVPNELGKIPAVFVYDQRSPVKGIGVSFIGDICDQQNFIANQLSEIEQLIRLQNHPSLVKTPDTEASAGAGAIISMPAELDGNLKPYLLQPSSQSIDGILASIQQNIQSIDRMAHMGALRAIETRQMSGAAMVAEFTLLDAKLSEKAQSLELAEEMIWRLWAEWQGMAFDGEIKYPDTFHIRDRAMDMDLLEKAARTNPVDPKVKQAIDYKIMELIMDKDEIEEYTNGEDVELEHPTTTAETKTPHIQQMIMDGLTDEQMLELHPELTQSDIDTAKQQLLEGDNASA